MDISTMFSEFKTSAFRVEGLPAYNVDSETEAFTYFQTNGQLPEGHNQDWADEIKANLARGASMKRLRLFTLPLNDYERFERAAYDVNTAAGEEIRALDVTNFEPVKDFWAFDDKWIAWMIYDSTGAWQGADVREMTDRDREMVRGWLDLFHSAPFVQDAYLLKAVVAK
jgi:hypothetical protein